MNAQTQTQAATLPTVGTPVYRHGETGYISRVIEAAPGGFIIGAGMQPIRHEFEVTFSGHVSQLGDGIVAPWLARAREMGLHSLSRDAVEELRASALEAQQDARAMAMRDRDRAATAAAAFKIEAAARMPADAKAVIVGELIEDKSDFMSDYHGSTTKRTLILAWSTHTRDIFSELRKASLNNQETAFLYDAPEAAEHREKYSMGAGYYLKDGWRDSNGWKVRKVKFYNDAKSVPVGEWSIPTAGQAAAPTAAPVSTVTGRVGIEEHKHTKHGFQMWIVTLADRVDRAEYDRLLGDAKARGGWYSRAWAGSPAGFAFKSEAAAQAFAGLGEAQPEAAPKAAPAAAAPVSQSTGTAEKLRGLADKLQGDIDHKFADRLTNTPKRQREAASARLDGYRLQRTQKALRIIADGLEAGTLPVELRGLTTKAAVFDLVRAEMDRSGGYYDAGHETGRPAQSTQAARTLWDMVAGSNEDGRAAEAMRAKLDNLRFANIPGFFPTPAPIVARMIAAADLPAAGRILEPEAGSGAILDMVRDAAPGCELVAFERHASLREILKAKGYELAGPDFMESDAGLKVDRVLMNPPFENGQDIAHVRRAFEHLKPGGRLVAIMSPGPFFRSDSKSRDFRQWFDWLGGEREDIPAGAFKESGTDVATVLVTICA